MPIPNFYSVWVDPFFYIAAAIFFTALVLLVYSVKRYIEMENKAGFSAEGISIESITSHETSHPLQAEPEHAAEPGVESVEETPTAPVREQPLQEQSEQTGSKAEIFLKGVHDNLLSVDERLKNIESALAKNKSTVNFTIEYLEDLIEKINESDKEKIKSRLEYLINNFLKH